MELYHNIEFPGKFHIASKPNDKTKKFARFAKASSFVVLTQALLGCGNIWTSIGYQSSQQYNSQKVYKDFVYVPTSSYTQQFFGYQVSSSGQFTAVPNSGTDLVSSNQINYNGVANFFSQALQTFILVSDIVASPSNVNALKIDPSTGGISSLGTSGAVSNYQTGPMVLNSTGTVMYTGHTGNAAVVLRAFSISSSTGAATEITTGAYPYTVLSASAGAPYNIATGCDSSHPANPCTYTMPYLLQIDATGKHLYIAYGNINAISMYTINADGSLGAPTHYQVGSGSQYYSSTSLSISASGKVLIAENGPDNMLYSFTIASDGTLTAAHSQSIGAAGQSVSAYLFDQIGKCLFVADPSASHAGITSYIIGNDGSFTSAGSPINVGYGNKQNGWTPDGKYAVIYSQNSYVGLYSENSSTCVLSPTSGSPFYIGTGNYSSISYTKAGNIAVVSDLSSTRIVSLSYNASAGTMAPIATVSSGTAYSFAPIMLSIPQQ